MCPRVFFSSHYITLTTHLNPRLKSSSFTFYTRGYVNLFKQNNFFLFWQNYVCFRKKTIRFFLYSFSILSFSRVLIFQKKQLTMDDVYKKIVTRDVSLF